jgi:hypothetical protein
MHAKNRRQSLLIEGDLEHLDISFLLSGSKPLRVHLIRRGKGAGGYIIAKALLAPAVPDSPEKFTYSDARPSRNEARLGRISCLRVCDPDVDNKATLPYSRKESIIHQSKTEGLAGKGSRIGGK